MIYQIVGVVLAVVAALVADAVVESCTGKHIPEHVYGPSYEDWIVQKRVPINYAACGSGTRTQLNVPADVESLDGAFQIEYKHSLTPSSRSLERRRAT